LEPNVFGFTQLCIVVAIGLLLVGIEHIMSRVSVCMWWCHRAAWFHVSRRC